LVLDDYHLITAAPVHQLLRFLLERQPPTMHLVLNTREDPPLLLPRLRVRGQVTEVRQRDLRFTPEEAAALCDMLQAYNFCLDDGESVSFGDLPPGDYDVAEAAPSQWKLDALVCVGGDSTTIGNGVQVHLGAGELVIGGAASPTSRFSRWPGAFCRALFVPDGTRGRPPGQVTRGKTVHPTRSEPPQFADVLGPESLIIRA